MRFNLAFKGLKILRYRTFAVVWPHINPGLSVCVSCAVQSESIREYVVGHVKCTISWTSKRFGVIRVVAYEMGFYLPED